MSKLEQQHAGLKNLKKQEIRRRLEQIREITGNEDTGLETGDLDTEFDPNKHDETMAAILGEDYAFWWTCDFSHLFG